MGKLIAIRTYVVTTPPIINNPEIVVEVGDGERVVDIDWNAADPFLTIYTVREMTEQEVSERG